MTTYELIDSLLDKRFLSRTVAKRMVFDAYSTNRIDGKEYEKLIKKIERFNY